MSTQQETVDFILEKLGHSGRFRVRAMFGEYALYADDQVVALVCDDLLHVKIQPESVALEQYCEKGEPYKDAKLHYVVTEDQLSEIAELPKVLFAIAKSRANKKGAPKKGTAKSAKNKKS